MGSARVLLLPYELRHVCMEGGHTRCSACEALVVPSRPLTERYWLSWFMRETRAGRIQLEYPVEPEDVLLASAQEEVDAYVREHAEAGLTLLLELCEQAPSDEALCFLGAGPLEEYLLAHPQGRQMVDEVVRSGNRRLSAALECASD